MHWLFPHLGAPVPDSGGYSWTPPPKVFVCPADRSAGKSPYDISYGAVQYGGGAEAGDGAPSYAGYGMRLRGERVRVHQVDSANGSLQLDKGLFGGADTSTDAAGPYLLPCETSESPDGTLGLWAGEAGYTRLRHGLWLQYISCDLSVRSANLAGYPYLHYFYVGPEDTSHDPAASWYRVKVFGYSTSPYAKTRRFSTVGISY